MTSAPFTGNASDDCFAATHWSVIVAAGSGETEPEKARAALAELCQTYWTPLYTFVRTRGYSVHDAQDLTQSFFVHLIEHEIYARTERAKGRFRSFLLAALKNFLADAYSHGITQKRGGAQALLPLDEEQMEAAESLFQTRSASVALPEDILFERSWAETLVRTGLERLSAEYATGEKGSLFGRLKVFLVGGAVPPPAYDDLAGEMGIPASSLRSHVTRLRARYRELLREQVRETVQSEADVDGELRELFRVLASA